MLVPEYVSSQTNDIPFDCIDTYYVSACFVSNNEKYSNKKLEILRAFVCSKFDDAVRLWMFVNTSCGTKSVT